jgi:hypothetical protein
MRFLALLRKELRECLPWMLLAAIIFLVIGGFILHAQAFYELAYTRMLDWYFTPGSAVYSYYLLGYPHAPLQGTGLVLFLTSIGLGLVLGVRQFWVAHFTRTWGFTLHRSVSRITILVAKVAAAAIVFLLSLGLIWIILYYYASQPPISFVPPTTRVFIEGWLFIALGGLGFAGCIILMTVVQWRLAYAFAVIIVGMAILVSQIIYTFLHREF